MRKIFAHYKDAFKGLSKDIWYLSVISLVNRAGTMVIPFLSLYLKNDLMYSESDIKWILVCFGVGSVIGSWLGGKLTDKIGFYKVMVGSLFLTGINFILLQYITSFFGLCLAILYTMVVADSFRPAIFVSIKVFSTPENQTRSIGLIRLAINAGMGIGPTLAGYIIITQSYGALFWIDGITCILAILLFVYLVKVPKQAISNTKEDYKNQVDKNAVYKDTTFWIFWVICFLFGMAFFQLISIFPLYYNEIFELNEFKIGLLMFINIAIIVAFEMPFLSFLEKKFIPITKHITMAFILLALSFIVLYNSFWVGILIISMILITFSEMLGFPYTNKFVLKRAMNGLEGSYMAMYTIAFSLAHIFSPLTSLTLIENYDYQVNWLVTFSYTVLAIVLAIWLHKRIQGEATG